MTTTNAALSVDPTTLVDVDLSELHRYLDLFSGRGEGWVRAGGLKVVTAVLGDTEEGTLYVEAAHPDLGRFVVTFEHPVVTDAPIDDDADDAIAVLPRPLRNRDLWLIQSATWEIHDRNGHHYGTIFPTPVNRTPLPDFADRPEATRTQLLELASDPRGTVYMSQRSIMGTQRLTLDVAQVRVSAVPVASSPGACPGCGGTTFSMAAQAHIPLEVGDDGLVLDSSISTSAELADRVSITNVLVTIRCTTCKLDHPGVDMSRYAGRLAGDAWEVGGYGKGSLRLSQFLAGRSED